MKGFSLIEILVVLSIASIAGTLLVSSLIQNNNLFLKQSTKISQGVNLNDTTSQISDSIKNASSIAATCPCPQVYTTNDQTIVAAIPSVNATGDILSNTFDYLVITRDSQNTAILRKIIYPNALSSRKSENQVLATTLSLVQFRYYDNNGNSVSPTAAGKINFTINVKPTNGLSSEQSSSSGQINLRND